jgi:sugar phosphate isomerase/epimerase
VDPTDFPAPALSCSTAPFFARPLREAFATIADAGFGGVEVMITRDPATQDARQLRELAKKERVRIHAIHAPFLIMTRKVWGTDPVGKIYRSIELAEEAHVPLVVVHPPFRWQTGYRRWLDDRLPELSEHTGVQVAVENMFPVRIRGTSGVSFHAKHQPEDLESFPHVVLDTSHAAVSGHDLFETFSMLRGRLVHIHLSNNAGRGWDSHLPIDQGVLPIDRFLATLATAGFSGSVSLELDLRPYLDDPAELQGVLVRNREICEERLALSA